MLSPRLLMMRQHDVVGIIESQLWQLRSKVLSCSCNEKDTIPDASIADTGVVQYDGRDVQQGYGGNCVC